MDSPPTWPSKGRRTDSVSRAEGVTGHSISKVYKETSREATPSRDDAHDFTVTSSLIPRARHRVPDHGILDASVWDNDNQSDLDEETQRMEMEDLDGSSGEDRDSDEDVNSDDELSFTQAARSMSVHLPLPDELKMLEGSQLTRSWNGDIKPRYRQYLDRLRKCTRTAVEVQYTIDRLPLAALKVDSLQLDQLWPSGSMMDLFAHAFLVHVWQLICFRVQTGIVYDEDISLSTHSASLFLSAYYVYKDKAGTENFTQGEFKAATEHFEARLHQMGGDKRWRTSQLLAHIPDPDLDDTPVRNKLASEYLHVLEERGLSGFTQYILEKEINKDATEGPPSALRRLEANTDIWDFTYDQLLLMLFHMGPDMIKAIIEGQVSRLAEIPCNVISNRLHQNGRTQPQPGTYMNSIVDRQGLSPTPHHWLNVCDLMLLYVDNGSTSDELADAIDQMFPSTEWRSEFSRRGLRRYTEWKNKVNRHSNDPCGRRRNLVKQFVFQIKARMSQEIEDRGRHVPLTAPVVEYGFGTIPQRRLKAHRQHRDSNFLMNLAEASFQHMYPGMFRLQQYILFLCFREVQCWLSEIFVTQLGQGYIHNGGGFSHHAAGHSNGYSYRNVPADKWERYTAKAADEGLLGKISESTRGATERLNALNAENEQLQKIEDAVDEVLQAVADMVSPQ